MLFCPIAVGHQCFEEIYSLQFPNYLAFLTFLLRGVKSPDTQVHTYTYIHHRFLRGEHFCRHIISSLISIPHAIFWPWQFEERIKSYSNQAGLVRASLLRTVLGFVTCWCSPKLAGSPWHQPRDRSFACWHPGSWSCYYCWLCIRTLAALMQIPFFRLKTPNPLNNFSVLTIILSSNFPPPVSCLQLSSPKASRPSLHRGQSRVVLRGDHKVQERPALGGSSHEEGRSLGSVE